MIYIGTSGFSYASWEGIFYPKKLKQNKVLKFYTIHFNSVEINSTFYHLPRAKTIEIWYNQTPKAFIFSIKASRFITHIKKLKEVKEPWNKFIKIILGLKEKLGPILFQLPPSLKFDKKRFISFLKVIKSSKNNLRFALEPRNKDWFSEEVFKIFEKENIALVYADSSRFPKIERKTADFFFIRMHGPTSLYSSEYSKEDLENLAKMIKKYKKENLDVYCYFNNDFGGYAVKNAKELKEILK